ncbi:MAG: hypothetical protein B7C54_11670 [Acidimicrobiales bacterium mtb01]|nr:MAG: hypothetical protein B7C54_11670 [Acidimicrobiales bacterium mtb01]
MQRGRLNLDVLEEFELFDGELDRYGLRAGDLLVVEGNGSESEIGRCARWGGEIEECVHQNHLIRCRPLVAGLEEFVLVYLNSPLGAATMRSLAVTTSGLYNLSVGKIRSIMFPRPPIEEQRRIVTRVRELAQLNDTLALRQAELGRAAAISRSASFDALARAEELDGTSAAWSRLGSKWELMTGAAQGVADLRSLLLRLAVRGKLARQSVDDEPASVLLERVARTRQDMANGRSRPLRDIPALDLGDVPPMRLPPGWAWCRLGHVLSLCRNGIATATNNQGKGFALLRISAGTSRSDRMVNLDDHTHADVTPEKALAYCMDPGDLLACRFNGNLRFVGAVAQVPAALAGPILHPDKLIRMKAIEVSHDYLRLALNSDVVRLQVERSAATTAGNIGINGAQLQRLVVPVPPLAEQARIAETCDRLFASIQHLQTVLDRREAAARAFARSSSELAFLA